MKKLVVVVLVVIALIVLVNSPSTGGDLNALGSGLTKLGIITLLLGGLVMGLRK